MDQILDECGLLEVRPVSLEAEGGRRAVIKSRRIRNNVVEVLMQEYVVRLDPKFPLVPAAVDGEGTFEISFAKRVVLKNLYGS